MDDKPFRGTAMKRIVRKTAGYCLTRSVPHPPSVSQRHCPAGSGSFRRIRFMQSRNRLASAAMLAAISTSPSRPPA